MKDKEDMVTRTERIQEGRYSNEEKEDTGRRIIMIKRIQRGGHNNE